MCPKLVAGVTALLGSYPSEPIETFFTNASNSNSTGHSNYSTTAGAGVPVWDSSYAEYEDLGVSQY